MTEMDERYMALALEEARKGWGMTSPNPMVGAVVVDGTGTVVGRGFHPGAGQPHAEVFALRDAGTAARGSTLYVTLEPCSTYGRTPPCVKAIIEAGVSQVVIGCLDVNPAHCGAAVAILEQAGIAVKTGVMEDDCRKLNKSFFHWITTKKPLVCLKMAMTLDGKIATACGQSRWITGSDARAYVQRLRQWADAVMIGGETARLDNASLLVHEPADWVRQPRRFVWTSRGLPVTACMVTDGGPAPRCVKPNTWEEWSDFLSELGAENVTALLLEGGGELAGNALRCGIVNHVAFFIAPKILGGRASRPVVGGESPESLMDALAVKDLEIRPVGSDWLATGDL